MTQPGPFNPYKILGIRRDSGAKRIKKAFRDAAKATHPDIGGTTDAFHAVRRAYFILADPERREKYDTTGKIDETTELSLETQVAGILIGLFEQFVTSGVAFKGDLDVIQAMTMETDKRIRTVQKVRADNDTLIKPLAALQKRITRAEGQNIFERSLQRRIDQLHEHSARADEQIAMLKACHAELEGYDCVVEMVQHHMIFSHCDAATNTSTGTF